MGPMLHEQQQEQQHQEEIFYYEKPSSNGKLALYPGSNIKAHAVCSNWQRFAPGPETHLQRIAFQKYAELISEPQRYEVIAEKSEGHSHQPQQNVNNEDMYVSISQLRLNSTKSFQAANERRKEPRILPTKGGYDTSTSRTTIAEMHNVLSTETIASAIWTKSLSIHDTFTFPPHVTKTNSSTPKTPLKSSKSLSLAYSKEEDCSNFNKLNQQNIGVYQTLTRVYPTGSLSKFTPPSVLGRAMNEKHVLSNSNPLTISKDETTSHNPITLEDAKTNEMILGIHRQQRREANKNFASRRRRGRLRNFLQIADYSDEYYNNEEDGTAKSLHLANIRKKSLWSLFLSIARHRMTSAIRWILLTSSLTLPSSLLSTSAVPLQTLLPSAMRQSLLSTHLSSSLSSLLLSLLFNVSTLLLTLAERSADIVTSLSNIFYRYYCYVNMMLVVLTESAEKLSILRMSSKGSSQFRYILKTKQRRQNYYNNLKDHHQPSKDNDKYALYNHQRDRKYRFFVKCNIHESLLSLPSNRYRSNDSFAKNKYLWVFGLFIATTILPCNLVNAASPLQNKQNAPANNHHLGLASSGGSLTPPSNPVVASSGEETEFLYPSSQSEEQFYDDKDNMPYAIPGNETILDIGNVTLKTPLFPTDLFTKEQLENGAVICHIMGVIYMFVALAIVCDEFFVPSLDVIIEKLGITDDVAGATFMAAGGSAPELFTSVIGVFVSFDDVGIGTIVGSAVFNILFVIGMCALFSKTVLTLTWWPLFRDCSFYSVSLLVLIYFFRDNLIYWWEALTLFFIYVGYVGFMKWNQQVERCVKKVITKNKVTRVRSTDQLMPAGNAANSSETSMATQPGGSVTSRASETRSGPAGSSSGVTGNSSGTGSTQTGAKFRHGLLQLMIHTIDPLHDGKVDEKATQLHAIASLKVLLDATKPQRGGATTSAANHVKINLKETTLADRPNGNIDTTIDSGNDVEDEPEPLNMAWPSTARKRLTYILVAPLLVPMWLTLPDTRTPRGKRFFPVTFIGSILWIAAFSYLMVWWANVAGDTARIPPEVMGLTFLAAGTSIPDLITSVIVARKGFGDMAVSSSVGSNIFDVTVGLPIPWLIYGIIYNAPVEVNSVGMVCSITILFMMLLFVVMSIACFRWKMNKGLGLTMFMLYFVFVAVSLMFEYDVITCPF